MQRPPGTSPRPRARELDRPGDRFLLPSRRNILDQMLQSLALRGGMIVLTGDPGVGKSWLCRRLRDETPASWRWISVDLSPALGPLGLERLVLRGLGRSVPAPRDAVDARIELEEALSGSHLDGVHHGLILDEAQAASDVLLEELRVLSNRVGTPEGFAGIVLVGQTGLLHRLARQPLSALGSKVALQVHLRPLGLNETLEFLRRQETSPGDEAAWVEPMHRATGGNPRQLAWRASLTAPRRVVRDPVSTTSPPSPPGNDQAIRPTAPLGVVPSRPLLREAEGMVEVGWEEPGESEPLPKAAGLADAPQDDPLPARPVEERDEDNATPLPTHSSFETFHERPVNDHYATLQAWREWSKTRQVADVARGTEADGAEIEDSLVVAAAADGEADELSKSVNDVRAEPEHGFAPYSQLFSRLKQARDSA